MHIQGNNLVSFVLKTFLKSRDGWLDFRKICSFRCHCAGNSNITRFVVDVLLLYKFS